MSTLAALVLARLCVSKGSVAMLYSSGAPVEVSVVVLKQFTSSW